MRIALWHGHTLVDEIQQPLGLRYFHIDPDTGFYLNGKPYRLYGVCTHDDRLKIGRAATKADYIQDCQMIYDLGARSVRLAHYQHDQTMYRVFDRLGIVVWTEDGLVNHLEQERKFDDNARQQFIELVKQNYNHPCVFVWSLYNELAFHPMPQSQTVLTFSPTPEPISEYRFNRLHPTKFSLPWQLIITLNQLAHDLDPSRLTVAASNQGPSAPINFITDIISFNRYSGWYGWHPSDWAPQLDIIRREVQDRMPGRAIGLSEYGAGQIRCSINHLLVSRNRVDNGTRKNGSAWCTKPHIRPLRSSHGCGIPRFGLCLIFHPPGGTKGASWGAMIKAWSPTTVR